MASRRIGGLCPSRRSRVLLLVLLAAPLLTGALLYLPVPGLEGVRRDPAGVVIADRHGEALGCLPDPEGAFVWKLSWEEIPEEARRVFLRVEDRRFYGHGGVDLLAVGRAAALNLAGRRTVSGASTISMQLARLIDPHGGALPGKLREAVTALRLEAQLGKREILRLYLNHLPFGYNTRGLGAAALRYFDRPVQELTRAQLLILATIPRAPARYDPFTAPESVLERAAALAPGLGISEVELLSALASCRRGELPLTAPHFLRRVREELVHGAGELLAGEADRGKLLRTRMGSGELVRVITTLDAGLCRQLQRAVAEELAREDASAGRDAARVRQASRPAASTAGPARVADAGVLVLANDGQVLAWIGSPHGGVFLDAVTVRSSSGSTLKPFLYALALEKGCSAASLLPDLPLSFGISESYRPENFDRKSRAAVRLRTALASSLNTPAVHLLSELGLDEFLALCERLGFAFPADAAARYGLGAAIGNAEVTLAELTRAFSVFPNRGLLEPLRLVRARIAADGVEHPCPSIGGHKRVFREETAWLIADILSDPAARAGGFGASSRFNSLPRAMFKSGTSSEYESLWCVGATAAYTVGVWAGNLDGRPSFGTTGSSLPARIALRALEALEERPDTASRTAPLPRPAALREVRICTASGFPASSYCPSTRIEYLPADHPSSGGRWPRAGAAGPTGAESCPLHRASSDGALRPAELLQAGLLAGRDGSPRILFPLPEQLFYRDRSVAGRDQCLEAWIAAPPRASLSVRVTGPSGGPGGGEVETAELTLSYPFRVTLALEPGTYRLEVSSAAGSDSVRYHVR